MLKAMFGIVLEQFDRNMLEAVEAERPVDSLSLTFEQLKRAGAIVVRPRFRNKWPFLCFKPRLTSIGEEMLYICHNYNKGSDRWFIGSDTLPWLR